MADESLDGLPLSLRGIQEENMFILETENGASEDLALASSSRHTETSLDLHYREVSAQEASSPMMNLIGFTSNSGRPWAVGPDAQLVHDRFTNCTLDDQWLLESFWCAGTNSDFGSGCFNKHPSTSKGGRVQITRVHGKDDVSEESPQPCSGKMSCYLDVQHKRPKVLLDSQLPPYSVAACSGTISCTSNSNRSPCGQVMPNQSVNERLLCMTSLPGDENPGCFLNSCCEESDESNESISKVENLEANMDLSEDLLHMVFSFLGHIDLCRAAMVCKLWRVVSSHEDFWKCLNFQYRNISVSQFANMCHRYPNAVEVNIFGAPSIDLLAREAMISLRNVEKLNVGKGYLGECFFSTLSNWYSLKHLIINDASLGNGQEIPIFHDGLHHLQIVKCRVVRISLRCPRLETLSLRRSNMAYAMLQCPLLLDLDIASCHKLSDAGIRSAVTTCLLLTSLDMSNCSCVTDETLREIALTCVHLRVLNASYCPNLSLESIRMPMLTNLKLQSCEGITSASMMAITYSHLLEVLELDCCGLLTSVSLDLSCLQNIRLRHCRKFSDLNLRAPKLSSISISNCPALHRINIFSNSLQKLALQKQESLSSLTLECSHLQVVDLTDCESLTNSICEIFNDAGGCPMLRSLVLDNCESLTMLGFRSSTLVELSLVGCRAMTSLRLACPNLEYIQLDGCDHLERAWFCPVGLRSLNLGICPKLNTLQVDAPHVTVLELKGCGVLSQASIVCPDLISLDASFCGQLTDECLSAATAACQSIESLILTSCSSVGSSGLFSLRQLQHLTLLDLSYTFLINLEPVFESCLQLQVLKLQACKYLTDSSLEPLHKNDALPALWELDLSYGTICQSAIEALLIHCTRLTRVSLNGCINMHDLDWDSNGPCFMKVNSKRQALGCSETVAMSGYLLESLNCVGCPNIKKVVIPSLARCFRLSYLNLSLSANLREVSLACCNLTFLNLSHCYSLEVLSLECPRLCSLFLQSCNITEAAAEEAISKCTMLETLDIRYCPKIYGECMVRLRFACPHLKRIFSSLPC